MDDLKKINLKYNGDFDYDEIIKSIKANKTACLLIEKLHLNDNDIKNNYELINNYVKYNDDCLTCNKMENCHHSTKGYVYELIKNDDNTFSDMFSICDKYKDYYTRKKNLIYTTFNEKELLDSSLKSFVIDNANLLGIEFVKKIIDILNFKKSNGAFLSISNSKIRIQLIKSLTYNLLLKNKLSVVKFSDMLKDIKSDFKSNNTQNTFKIIIESDILIIDGLGNESITSWSRDEILLSLLDNRLQNDKVTILCSEFSLDELKKLYRINYNDEAKANQIIEKIKEIKK